MSSSTRALWHSLDREEKHHSSGRSRSVRPKYHDDIKRTTSGSKKSRKSRSSRITSKARSRARLLGNSHRPGRRPIGRGLSSVKNQRAKLIDILAQVDMVTYQDTRKFDGFNSKAGAIQCQYCHAFSLNNSSGVLIENQWPFGSRNPNVMREIANTISTTYQDIVFEQVLFHTVHQINSRSTQQIIVEGYLFEARENILNNTFPFVFDTPGGSIFDDVLGWSYYNQSQQGGTADNNNTVFKDSSISPFQMNPLLTFFKIKKVKKRTLLPGGVCYFSVKDTKPRLIRPTHVMSNRDAATTTFYGSSLNYTFMRGETFWVFKVWSGQIGVNSSSANIQDLGAQIMLHTDTKYHYKYVQDNRTVIATYGFGPQVAANNTNVINPLADGTIIESSTLI